MRDIDYGQLAKNYDEIINTLEYDSMRSAGKAKINAASLSNLYALRERAAKKVSTTVTPAKEEK